MAFGIQIYEQDNYLFELIKERLSCRFPSAYIKRAGAAEGPDLKLIEEIYTIYDNRQFKEPLPGGTEGAIPLFADDGKGHSIIDMRKIYDRLKVTDIRTDLHKEPVGLEEDRLRLLISYAYIDERENFIRSAISPGSFESLHPIRIDLMSGIRMPASFSSESKGSVTKLLRTCTDKRFRPVHILEYLNPDITGFLSCGKPDNEDDVFDIGINACTVLLKKLKTLCEEHDTGALVVAEGWKVNELLELIGLCDTLHILLPARMCTEDTGLTKALGLFRRSLPSGALMTVHYCEDYRHEYESINI